MKKIDIDEWIIRAMSVVIFIALCIYLKNDTEVIEKTAWNIKNEIISTRTTVFLLGTLSLVLINVIERHTIFYFKDEVEKWWKYW